MQEEVEHRAVTLAISTSKLTGRVLKTAILKYLTHLRQKKQNKGQVNTVKPTGKQTLKQLVGQNQGVSNIEISDANIRSFDHVARKYSVDYAVKKDRNATPPRYLIFFKARDADVLTAAFKEYSATILKHTDKPSVLDKLHTWKEHMQRFYPDKTRQKDKGLEL